MTRAEATTEGDPCTCGHSSEDHRESEESSHGGPCSICTCNRFDWDLDAGAPSGASAPGKEERDGE